MIFIHLITSNRLRNKENNLNETNVHQQQLMGTGVILCLCGKLLKNIAKLLIISENTQLKSLKTIFAA